MIKFMLGMVVGAFCFCVGGLYGEPLVNMIAFYQKAGIVINSPAPPNGRETGLPEREAQ